MPAWTIQPYIVIVEGRRVGQLHPSRTRSTPPQAGIGHHGAATSIAACTMAVTWRTGRRPSSASSTAATTTSSPEEQSELHGSNVGTRGRWSASLSGRGREPGAEG